MKEICRVLWCQMRMPRRAPMLPPMMATRNSVASGMRQALWRARHLSMPYKINASVFIIKRYARISFNMVMYDLS